MTAPYLHGFPRILAIFALSIATFMIVLDYSIANVSIPYISGDLGVSTNQGTYVITSFAVGNAVILAITGSLTKKIGAVKLIIISLLGFVFFSWLCGAAWNFETLVIARFLQGVLSGPLIPLSQSLIVSTNPPEERNKVIAIWSVVVIAAPVIGPLLGGWISFDYVWPWIFYINIPVGLFSALIIWFYVRRFETKREKYPLDWIGFILLTIGVACLQFILDKGEQYDWLNSPLIASLSVVSFLSFAYLIVWELFHPTPVIDMKLFTIPSYTVSIIFIVVMYSIYFGTIVLVPLWLQTNMNYNSIWAGIAVAPIGLAPFLLSTFSGWMITRFGKIRPLCICILFFSFSSFYTAFFTTDVDIYHIWISRFLLGCALVFMMTPLMALFIQDVSDEKLPSATGVFHFFRALFGGVGTAIFTTLWIRRSAYHHERVGSNLTEYSPVTRNFFETLKGLGLKKDEALAVTNNMLTDQAAMLSINDCFYLMGWLFLVLLLILPMGRQKRGALQKAHLHAVE